MIELKEREGKTEFTLFHNTDDSPTFEKKHDLFSGALLHLLRLEIGKVPYSESNQLLTVFDLLFPMISILLVHK